MTTVAPFSLGCSNRDSDVKVLLPTLVLPLSLSPPPSHPFPLTPSVPLIISSSFHSLFSYLLPLFTSLGVDKK